MMMMKIIAVCRGDHMKKVRNVCIMHINNIMMVHDNM